MSAEEEAVPPGNVQVVCRVRPSGEYGSSGLTIESGDGGDIIQLEGASRDFNVTKAFGPDSSQEDVFNFVGLPSLDYVTQGYGACVLAYGQTGSGKTWTMTGNQEAPGLIPRMIEQLFQRLINGFQDFTVSCQYVEIYMEKVRDLLNPSRAKNPWDAAGPKVNIRYDGKRVRIENAKKLIFSGNDAKSQPATASAPAAALTRQLLGEVDAAGKHRAVRGHALNAESSRSHAVLILEITGSAGRKAGRQMGSTLMLVDLAGNENIGKAGVEGEGKAEAMAINKSLSVLSRCIEALAGGAKVPFRESSLTKILTPALDGRSCCTLIAALRPDHATETKETLKFTETALKVKVKPRQTSSEALGAVHDKARDLEAEIEAMRQEIAWLKKSGGTDSDALKAMIQEREAALAAKVLALSSLQQEISETEEKLHVVRQELDASRQAQEQERQRRVKAEEENDQLQQRLRDAQLREREAAALLAQRRQALRGERLAERRHLLARLQDARQRAFSSSNFTGSGRGSSGARSEEVLRSLLQLVRHLQREFQTVLDEDIVPKLGRAEAGDSGQDMVGASQEDEGGWPRALKTSISELRYLGDSIEKSLRDWPDVQLWLSDLAFALGELASQAGRLQRLFQAGDEPDLERCQAVLEEVVRLSSYAAEAMCPPRAPAVKALPLGSRGKSTTNAALQQLRLLASSELTGGGPLLSILAVLWRCCLRWRPQVGAWEGHWLPRCASQSAEQDAARAATVLEGVKAVFEGLEAAFAMLQNDLERLLQGNGSTARSQLTTGRGLPDGGCAEVVSGLQASCQLAFKELQQRQLPGTDVDIANEEPPPGSLGQRIENLQLKLPELGNWWQDLQVAKDNAARGEVAGQSAEDGHQRLCLLAEEALCRVGAHSLCEEDVLRAHLSRLPLAFVRDAAKFMCYGSPKLFDNFTTPEAGQGFNWDAPWASEKSAKVQQSLTLEAKIAFFSQVALLVQGAKQRWGWGAPSDAVATLPDGIVSTDGEPADAISADRLQLLLLLAQLCLAVEASAAENDRGSVPLAGAQLGLAGRVLAEFAVWADCLRMRAVAVAGALEDKSFSADQDLEALKATVAKLQEERARQNTDREELEVQLAGRMQELQRLQQQNLQLSSQVHDGDAERSQELELKEEALRQARQEAETWQTKLQRAQDREAAIVRVAKSAADSAIEELSQETGADLLASVEKYVQSPLQMLEELGSETADAGAAAEALRAASEGLRTGLGQALALPGLGPKARAALAGQRAAAAAMLEEVQEAMSSSKTGETRELLSCLEELLQSQLRALDEGLAEDERRAPLPSPATGTGARAVKKLRDSTVQSVAGSMGDGDDEEDVDDEDDSPTTPQKTSLSGWMQNRLDKNFRVAKPAKLDMSEVQEEADEEAQAAVRSAQLRTRLKAAISALTSGASATESLLDVPSSPSAAVPLSPTADHSSAAQAAKLARLEQQLQDQRDVAAHAAASLEEERKRADLMAQQLKSFENPGIVERQIEVDDLPVDVPLIQVLPAGQPEFCQLKSMVEGTASSSGVSVNLSVRTVRKICNPRLEERFREGMAEQMGEGLVLRGLFHGAPEGLCEQIAKDGFHLPAAAGMKPGPYGNCISLSSRASRANEKSAGPGRLRSLLVCDVAPGRVFVPTPGDSDSMLPQMDLAKLRELPVPSKGGNACGFDSVFAPGAGKRSTDLYAMYDPRVVLPTYIVDFSIDGLGSEARYQEPKDLLKLRAELEDMRLQSGTWIADAIRKKYLELAHAIRQKGPEELCPGLWPIERRDEPDLWDRCVDRLSQALADGPGLQSGLEAIMTRLERIEQPAQSAKFCERAAALLYPEESTRLLFFRGCWCQSLGGKGPVLSATALMDIAQEGFSLEDLDSKDIVSDAPKAAFGAGLYFGTSVTPWSHARNLGSHQLLLCEVLLGKPQLITGAAKRGCNEEAVRAAGCDSLHHQVAPSAVPGGKGGGEEWVVYNTAQALPAFLISYDVQPRAVAARLLQEMMALEDRRRQLDAQMAEMLQELERARRNAEETRLALDEQLARQLMDEEEGHLRAQKERQAHREGLDFEAAKEMQELEKARQEKAQIQRQLAAMERQLPDGHPPPHP